MREPASARRGRRRCARDAKSSRPGDRNDYALEAAKRYPNRFAVIGRIPLKNPQAAALLAKWKEQPGMLGVRLTDSAPDWFWSEAEKAGLPVMFLTPAGMRSLLASRSAIRSCR
jgi:predicted TIM-barrel fold metal-dependent hydrolase